MKNRPVRHRAEFVLYLAVTWLLVRLPLSAVRRLGRVVGWCFWSFDRRHRQRALDNLAAMLPDLEERARRETARRCFLNYGAIFFETAHAGGQDPEVFAERFDVEGWEHLETTEAEGRGCFLVTGHFGNWELALYPLGRRPGKVHLVARPPDNPLVAADAARIRARIGHELLPRQGAGHRMRNVLRRRGRVAIVIDQRVAPWNGILVPFLGKLAWSSPVVASLSVRGDVPVVPIVCVPSGSDRYEVRILPPIRPEGRGLEAEATMTSRYLSALEQEIRRRPEMWLWIHRRWRLSQRVHAPDRRTRNRRISQLPDDETRLGLACLTFGEDVLAPLRELQRGTFLDRGDDVMLSGGGAERAAAALGHGLVATGYAALYGRPQELAGTLARARGEGEEARWLRELDTRDLLIVDGTATAPLDRDSSSGLLDILEQRRRRRSILLACDRPLEEWVTRFSDPARARRTIGEIVAGATVIDLDSAAAARPLDRRSA